MPALLEALDPDVVYSSIVKPKFNNANIDPDTPLYCAAISIATRLANLCYVGQFDPFAPKDPDDPTSSAVVFRRRALDHFEAEQDTSDMGRIRLMRARMVFGESPQLTAAIIDACQVAHEVLEVPGNG